MSVWKRERPARAGESKRATHYSYAVRWREGGTREGKMLTLNVGHTSGHGVQAAQLDEWIKSEGGNVTRDQARAWLFPTTGGPTDEDEDDDADPVPTVYAACELWVSGPGKRGKRRDSSRAKYRTLLAKLGEAADGPWAIGDVPADKLTTERVAAWFGYWEGNGGRGGHGHAETTLAAWHVHIKGACERYAPAGVFGRGTYDSSATEVDAKILPAEQVQALITTARTMDDAMTLPVWFIAEMGVRWGEMAGLVRGDVDLERGTVSIRRQIPSGTTRRVAFADARRDLKAGRNTRRTLTMSAELTAALGLIADFDANAPVFAPTYDDSWRGGGWRTTWARLKAATDVPAELRTHDLRHTAAMRWLRAGQPLPVVARKLGDSVPVVDATYSHWLADDMAAVGVMPVGV